MRFSVGYISEKLHFSLENSSCYESLFTEPILFLQREIFFSVLVSSTIGSKIRVKKGN